MTYFQELLKKKVGGQVEGQVSGKVYGQVEGQIYRQVGNEQIREALLFEVFVPLLMSSD